MTGLRVSAVIGALTFLLGACAGAGSDVPSGSRLGDSQAETAERKKKPKGVLKKAERIAKKAGAPGAKGPGASKAAGAAPTGSDNGVDSAIDPSLARASARVSDAPDDAQKQGLTPGYAEVVEASITGLGENFRMVLRVNGEVPSEMPNDKTHWIIAFGMTGPEDDEGYSFGAQATTEGWQAYAGGKEGQEGFPGTFLAQGREIVMTIPWDHVRGPRRFEWYAASNYFQQIADTTHYSVDLVPNKDLAKFPN